ncbi:MAG: hypothetical protein J7647_23010 [Cyanobacteria bacterium SBLK]|nr:hypothetical protein [Cyanobacteria bacterium SBLK]
MGRQSKRKQIKRESASQPKPSEADINPNKFIRQIEKQGYRFDNIDRSPDIPTDKVDPQV